MLSIIKSRLQQKHRTMAYPDGPPPALSDRFAGRPLIRRACPSGCRACLEVCPVGALRQSAAILELDLGRCLFCRACADACPHDVIAFSGSHQTAAGRRDDLRVRVDTPTCTEIHCDTALKFFRRSLKLRQVSAGGCNACEADVNVLGTPAWDMGRFGIQLVASPRHADGLLVTGPVTANMRVALEKTYAAMPEPRIVIACGACAISGGPFIDHPETANGVTDILPVDLFIPGCPPHPLSILDGLLRLLGRPVPAAPEKRLFT